MESVTGKILGVSSTANYYLENLKLNISPMFLVDILIVAIIFYWIYIFLKETRAIRIIYGLFILVIIAALGELLNLVLLNWILKSVMTMLMVAIPVVFQPELRTALEKIGRTKLLGELAFSKDDEDKSIDIILRSVEGFCAQNVGALMVIKRQTGLKEYIDTGVSLNSKLSVKLLGSIFFPKSPLHDGAVIISRGRILSAGSILPVSQNILGGTMGTRHKAGLGITEISDAVSIIVSEETGKVSFAVGGKLETKLSLDQLKNRLNYYVKNEKKSK